MRCGNLPEKTGIQEVFAKEVQASSIVGKELLFFLPCPLLTDEGTLLPIKVTQNLSGHKTAQQHLSLLRERLIRTAKMYEICSSSETNGM